MLLLRVGKYKSLWEEPNPLSDIIEAEFTDENGNPDLALSVYRIEVGDVVRAFVEHFAAPRLRPPNSRTSVDLSNGPAKVKPDPVPGTFEFIKEAHCELLFHDSTQLETFVALVRSEIAHRGYRVTGAQVKAYVRARLAADDPEWVPYVAANPSWNL